MADNLEKINCPACGSVMKKIYIPETSINIDVCVDGCGGLFFDNREYEKIDEFHDDITPIIEALKDKKFKKTNEDEIRICPVCGSNMVKNFASAKRQIQVDDCYNCGGKFLDYGELEKIRAEYNSYVEKTTAGLKDFYLQYANQNVEIDSKERFYKEIGSIESEEIKYMENINNRLYQNSLPYHRRLYYKNFIRFIKDFL